MKDWNPTLEVCRTNPGYTGRCKKDCDYCCDDILKVIKNYNHNLIECDFDIIHQIIDTLETMFPERFKMAWDSRLMLRWDDEYKSKSICGWSKHYAYMNCPYLNFYQLNMPEEYQQVIQSLYLIYK